MCVCVSNFVRKTISRMKCVWMGERECILLVSEHWYYSNIVYFSDGDHIHKKTGVPFGRYAYWWKWKAYTRENWFSLAVYFFIWAKIKMWNAKALEENKDFEKLSISISSSTILFDLLRIDFAHIRRAAFFKDQKIWDVHWFSWLSFADVKR